MTNRFRSRDATPPWGCYEYGLGDTAVTARTKAAISRLALDLRTAAGLPCAGDGFSYVEEYMCPRLPDGFCMGPSGVPRLHIDEVKSRTTAFFAAPLATADVIAERVSCCLGCPDHATRGFCMGCSGLLEWIYRGFAGRRARLPADAACGVCARERAFAAALTSVAEPPADAGAPECCWRKPKEDLRCQTTKVM